MSDKQTKRYSASLFFREIQSKPSIRYHFSITSMAMLKTHNNKGWSGGNEKWYSTVKKFLKKLIYNYHMFQKFLSMHVKRIDMYTNVYNSFFHISPILKTQMSLN